MMGIREARRMGISWECHGNAMGITWGKTWENVMGISPTLGLSNFYATRQLLLTNFTIYLYLKYINIIYESTLHYSEFHIIYVQYKLVLIRYVS
jgi:hypothetical protein